VIGRGKDAHGILVVDKPVGPTSHDVVAQIRRALGTRAVGHAGTLDPAASGVLVVAVGAGTKLLAHLVSRTKRYLATVRFGVATTTCDGEGDVVAEAPLPSELVQALRGGSMDCVESALLCERQRREQVPPQFSAIKIKGQSAHRLARRGEVVILAPRPIEVHALAVVAAREDALDLELHVSKGYYVRSLARDLGESLGVPAHLAALRRTESEPFTLAESVAMPCSPEQLINGGQSVSDSARRLFASVELTDDGVRRARHGQRLSRTDFATPPSAELSAWFDADGELVALGREREAEAFGALRVFAHLTSSSVT
jgi:tRNA pseudouridine55 synthase